MLLRFKLNDVMQGGIERIAMCSGTKPGTTTNKRLIFIPGKVYRATDPIFIQYIKGEIGDVREKMVLTDSLKAELSAYKVAYEVKKCGTCTSAKPKAYFNPFVIVEEVKDDAE